MKLVTFFKLSLLGPDGKPSHQKMLIFYMTLLFTFVVLSVGFGNFYYPESVYHIIAGVIIGQSAIRAWQITKDHQIEKDRYNEITNTDSNTCDCADISMCKYKTCKDINQG